MISPSANKHFLSRRPDLFIAQGYFEEIKKNSEEARRLYKHAYEQVSPGLLSGVLRHIHLERRSNNYEEVDKLFLYAMSVAEEAGNSGNLLYIISEYTRFHQFVMKNLGRALEIFEGKMEKVADQKAYYHSYISALNCLPDVEEKLKKIKAAYEFGLRNGSALPASEQLELWVSYIDFIRNSWNKTEEIKDIEARFRKAFHHQSVLTGEFKTKCKIKRMKRSETYDYPEANKR